ncbi:MAG: excinuclease ABC subunit UvrC [Bacillota bacterium]|nr:excinuclease ABC subunit UvrC [Bacillota bacterium]
MNDKIAEKLKKLPAQPGCYLMKDAAGTVIYVGKAVNLRHRVRSYFTGSHDGKTELLVANIDDLETIVVDSEAEALILESNLIKEYLPHYNILMRDDKHYPYLRLTLDEQYPRLLVARRAKNDGSKYFGPYPDVHAMRLGLGFIRDSFPLRSCSGKSWRAGQRACLNAHIGRCLAPCEGRVSAEQYRAVVDEVQMFLSGKTKELLKRQRQLMDEAAAELRFEQAARHRDIINGLTQIQMRQQLDVGERAGHYDVAAVAVAEGQAVAQVFFVRGGKVIGNQHQFFANAGSGDPAALMQSFFLDYYAGGDMLPPHIYVNALPEDKQPLEQLLAASCGHKPQISKPQAGDKRRLLRLAEENAKLLLSNQLNSEQRREQRNAEALERLRTLLQLPRTPQRIECYDISHIQGAHMVGSMAVALGGEIAPRHGRKFKIKTLDHSDDFAALAEVLERRWRRGREEREQGKTPLDFGNWPELLLIDGGKGQLSAVRERLDELGAGQVNIIALAKENEEIYTDAHGEPLLLPREDAALQLLQRLRDEAHRMAVTYHRQLRGKGQLHSELDDIEGVGPVRRQALLRSFGSLKNIRAASLEELAAAPKMNKAAALKLYAALHPQQAGTGESKGEEE